MQMELNISDGMRQIEATDGTDMMTGRDNWWHVEDCVWFQAFGKGFISSIEYQTLASVVLDAGK